MEKFNRVRPAQSKPSAATGRGTLVPAGLVGAGISLIVVVGLIHLINSPEDLEEGSYTGLLYLLNFFGALASAVGIYRGKRWGWALGFLVAGGAFAGYMISRTVGLPGLPVETEWRALSAGRRPVRGSVSGHLRSSQRGEMSGGPTALYSSA
jgi:hypothetical protein